MRCDPLKSIIEQNIKLNRELNFILYEYFFNIVKDIY
jgi:hypothetical protein